MQYITNSDFDVQIQDVNFQQIISNNEGLRENAVLIATGEARSFLIQKYYFDEEMAKTGTDRDPQLVAYIIDLALYHLHSRIAPRNIPDLRQTRYENAVLWLRECGAGNVTPKIRRRPAGVSIDDPGTGDEVVRATGLIYGSQPKSKNMY